jgi:4-hydroxythreonine-4-phosphate dehydrogenase
VAYLQAAVAAVQGGVAAGLVTGPISKTWARRAGFSFPGHTEYLAQAFAAEEVAMMFAGDRLRVALVTTHIPLAAVAGALRVARVRAVIALLADSLRRDFAIAEPRIAVAGLNPHAGEGGLIGDDEQRVIVPALGPLAHGSVHGPMVPDSVFRAAVDGIWDGVVAMYHDQALIPVKLVEFERAVNVTLGLPVVRTSPDHGTAYDIAGRGIARSTSMRCALELAAAMIDRRAGAGPSAADRGGPGK